MLPHRMRIVIYHLILRNVTPDRARLVLSHRREAPTGEVQLCGEDLQRGGGIGRLLVVNEFPRASISCRPTLTVIMLLKSSLKIRRAAGVIAARGSAA